MKAREIMQSPIEDVMPFDDIYMAFGKMRRLGLHHLPVVDTHSQLIGILTDREILRAMAEVANSEAPMPLVSDCMIKEFVTCFADDPLSTVIDKLLTHHINCMPVIDEDQRCLGMITSRDVIRYSINDGKRILGETSTIKYAEM